MRISQDWLNEFVSTPATVELAHAFEMAGIGVESSEDGIFELEVTNNRGDWLSAIGLAREIAALTDKRLRLTSTDVEETSSSAAISVDIESSKDCPRYFARLVENLQVGPSPDWMQRRLTECGMRPVNNIVDVTNYVMLETGQPLHAFDADKVAGHNIVVRRAFEGEKLHTLDDAERVLTAEVLVIADAERAIGIAGVMGGLHSEVTPSTTRVLLESAHFDGLRVRRGARALGLSTEASRRFERWVDPNGVRRAADRAAQLLHEHASGTVTSVFADRYLQPITPLTVRLRSARCNAVLGLRLTTEVISKSLERLGLSVMTVEEGVLDVTIPTFRRDISREIDLIEEVARVYGYEQIPTTLPKTVNPMAGRSLSKRLEERAKSALLRCGLTEVITFSMENVADVERSGIATAPVVKFANPISEDYTQMRTSLVPSLLGVLGKNARSGARVFELGKVYLPQEGEQLPRECRHLGMALLQPAAQQAHWQKNATVPADDFYSLKAVVETTLSELGVPPLHWRAASEAPFHPGRCARLSIDSQDVGVLGEVHPDIAARYDLAGRAVIGVLDFDPLVRHIALLKQYRPLDRFPAIERDLALVLRAEQPAATVEGVLRAAGGELLRTVRTFDVYTGAPIPEGSKSMALSLLFRADDRTLTDTEIEALMSQIRSAAEQELGANLR